MKLKKIFQYYWQEARKFKKSGISVFVFYGLGGVLASVLTPIIYKNIIDAVSNAETVASVTDDLYKYLWILLLVFVLFNAFYRIADYSVTYFITNVRKIIEDDVMKRLQKYSYGFFTDNFTGSLVSKSKRYVNSFEDIFFQVVFTLWMTGLDIIGSFIVLAFLDYRIALVLFFWSILYFGITIAFIKKKMKYDLVAAEQDSKVTGAFSDILTNILNVKMFSSRKKESSYFAKQTYNQKKANQKAWNLMNLQFVVQGIFTATLQVGGMFTVVYLWIQGEVTVGTVVLVQMYFFAISKSLWNFGNSMTRLMRSVTDAWEMIEIFEKTPKVLDMKKPEKCRIGKGEIQMQDLTFAYSKGDKKVFKDFSLSIQPGEKVGLVGSSGSGKTTISKLLLRFLDIQKGKILIDGQDITKITQDDLRRNIAYVPQDPILFHRSLKENIAYGKEDATDAEVIEMAKKSHAHEFISDLKEGYETLVGERGIKLSGGQRQRVAIARAFLKDAPILILDEATSSLDSVSEKYIQDGLHNLMEGRTTVVIAHRLSTIQEMDRIIVLGHGEILEQGTHEELLKKQGEYFTFWKQQTEEKEANM